MRVAQFDFRLRTRIGDLVAFRLQQFGTPAERLENTLPLLAAALFHTFSLGTILRIAGIELE